MTGKKRYYLGIGPYHKKNHTESSVLSPRASKRPIWKIDNIVPNFQKKKRKITNFLIERKIFGFFFPKSCRLFYPWLSIIPEPLNYMKDRISSVGGEKTYF